MNQVNWSEQCKIRIRLNASLKHEVVKLILARCLWKKYVNQSHWVKIYSEYNVVDSKICDIYFENAKTKECYAYEIQDKVTNQWLLETTGKYRNWKKYLFNTDWVLINLKDCPNKVDEIEQWIEDLIV